MSESPIANWFNVNARQAGFFLLLAGWGGAYWIYLSFLRNAKAHEPVLGMPGGFALLFSLGILGFICVLGGRRAADTLQRKGLGWVRYAAFLVVCLVLPGFLAYLWMRHEITLAGYD
jgi:hypothetical protein